MTPRPQPKKPTASVRGIKCKKCGAVQVGHNAANCGRTPAERALAARSKPK